MKILLFGLVMQGKAVVYDLERTETVTEIVAAEMEPEAARRYVVEKGYRKTRHRMSHAPQSLPARGMTS